MKTEKSKMHFTDSYLINPTNPVSVNLIGAGGTGSKVMTALMDMSQTMNALGHSGLQVRLWDDDVVTQANLGRQRFAVSELGLYKSVAIINRINRWSGLNWKAETTKFQSSSEHAKASIYISCVDNVATRFEIAQLLTNLENTGYSRNRPLYWMDFGNSRYTGQVILSTIGTIQQPKSGQFDTVGNLPFITQEFESLLRESEQMDDTPSCSLAEALEKQDLYINSTLADMGCSLLWKLFRNGMIDCRGFFLNLETFHAQALKIT